MIGELRWRAELYQPARAQDATGDSILTYVLVATIWYGVEHGGGQETTRNDQQQSVSTKRLVIRDRDDIQPDWKIRTLAATTPGRTEQWFEIVSIGRPVKGYLPIDCAEIVTPPTVSTGLTWGGAAFTFGGA